MRESLDGSSFMRVHYESCSGGACQECAASEEGIRGQALRSVRTHSHTRCTCAHTHSTDGTHAHIHTRLHEEHRRRLVLRERRLDVRQRHRAAGRRGQLDDLGCVCACVCVCVCAFACVCVAHMSVCIARVCVYMCVCMCMCTHTRRDAMQRSGARAASTLHGRSHVHTHTHMKAHTHTHAVAHTRTAKARGHVGDARAPDPAVADEQRFPRLKQVGDHRLHAGVARARDQERVFGVGLGGGRAVRAWSRAHDWLRHGAGVLRVVAHAVGAGSGLVRRMHRACMQPCARARARAATGLVVSGSTADARALVPGTGSAGPPGSRP